MANLKIIENATVSDIACWIAERLRKALLSREEIAMTVPGGTTPPPILEELAKEDLPWKRITIWPGDDRIVAPDHPASNVGLIRSKLNSVAAQIVPLTENARPPYFEIAWLGMGSDGHIASLFPNTDPQVDDPCCVRRLTPDPLPPEAPFERISLTIPSLANANEIMFAFSGELRKALFLAASEGKHDLPVARLLRTTDRQVTCFC